MGASRFNKDLHMTMDLVSMRTGQHADPALTSEATLCGNLKRKFGERSAYRFRKHAQEPPANEFAAPS
jgi:hypothetical protein